MTVYECVKFVDEVKPNAFPESAKIAWLGQLEGKIASEILLMAPAELAKFHYTTADRSKQLLIDPPYDDIYTAYLTAKVDSKNGEFNRLSTAAQAYNRLWDELNQFIAERYDPAAGYYGKYSTHGIEERSLRAGTRRVWYGGREPEPERRPDRDGPWDWFYKGVLVSPGEPGREKPPRSWETGPRRRWEGDEEFAVVG